MESIVFTVILIVSFLFLVRKRGEIEPYYSLKLIGYFLLGSFAYNLNHISLPLGFIIYLLFFRPKLNIHIKRIAAIFGFIGFILFHWIFPYANNLWEGRPVNVEHELGSVYTMNFQDEYELIKQELKKENLNLRLENFNVDYVNDGTITDLRWQLLGGNGNTYTLYDIQYDHNKSRYRITISQVDTWLQYDRLVEADHFFQNLKLNIKEITNAKGDFSAYGIQSSGERVNFAIKDQSNFILSNGEIQLLKNEQLPVEAYYISIFGMEKMEEKRDEHGNITQENFEGTETSNYLFDVNFIEK